MVWSSSREADLDALANEALADPTVFASCCGLAVLRRTAGGFHLHQGCAGLRQAPENTASEDEKTFAVEVMQRLRAGDQTLTDLISTDTLKEVSLAQWKNFIKEAAKMENSLRPDEAVLVRKSQGWMIFHQRLFKGKLELKIAVDATNRLILGMSLKKIGDEVDQAGKGGREAEALALKVVQMVLDGWEDSLVGMIAPRTLESVCEADWRHFVQDVVVKVTKIVEKPHVAGKKQGWWIIPVKTTDDLLVFEVVVDAQTQQILGLTVKEEMPMLDGQMEPSPVEINDSWHIGSCAKSMTATLAAILISKGLLPSFQLSVETALKDDPILGPAAMTSGFKDVTLELLLTNRGGCWGTPDNRLWTFAWKLPGSQSTASSELRRAARRQYIEGVLALTPHEIDQYEYSNDGYALAGVMMETFVNMAYEDLMHHYLFEPLQMTRSNFGAMGAGCQLMAERCQYIWSTRDAKAQDPAGPGGDNPQVIAPAGCVHCSLEDMGHYLSCHLSSETAATLLGISQQCWELLHQPCLKMESDESGYAMGWNVQRTEEHCTLSHCGSNYMNFICMKLWPSEGIAAIVTFNMGIEATTPAQLIADRLFSRVASGRIH